MEANQLARRDPICGILVPEGSAIIRRVADQLHFLCSKDCAEAFDMGYIHGWPCSEGATRARGPKHVLKEGQ